jgi:cytochrome c-type biogenesis protein CcmH/NrfG
LEKEEELPDWINEIAETTPTEEAPIAPELPVTKILPTLPTELSEEWASEAAPVAESEEVKTLETQPQEADWVSIAGTSQQSELAGPIEKEVESTTFAPELSVVPTVETSEVEAVTLEDAQNALNQGLPAQAAEVFTGLVKQNQQLEEVIKEVQEALYRFPVDVNLWVVLGDAYLHTDELQDALDAYSKAEDLVR